MGARSAIRASADPMATKCYGLKLKEIFNNCLPGMAPIEIAHFFQRRERRRGILKRVAIVEVSAIVARWIEPRGALVFCRAKAAGRAASLRD